jgi:integrase
MTGTVKVVLFRSKKLKSGEHPVMLRVTQGKKQSYVSLGVNCPAAQWDDKANRPKKSHPLYKEMVTLLDRQEVAARRELFKEDVGGADQILEAVVPRQKETTAITSKAVSTGELVSQGVEGAAITLDVKAGQPLDLGVVNPSILDFFDVIILRKMEAGKIRYASVFRDTQSHLISMMTPDPKNPELSFYDINVTFLADWEARMLGKQFKTTTRSIYFRTLRALIGYARKEKLVPKNFNPFEDFAMGKYHRIKTLKRAISPGEVEKLGKVRVEPWSHQHHARQTFLFTYYCWGINFMDIAYLKVDSVLPDPDGGLRLRYKRHKTGHSFNIKLLPEAERIWNFYMVRRKRESEYVWPILDSTVHIEPQQIDWRIHRCNKLWNKALRQVADLAGIREYLTFYVGRHSFATALKNARVPIAFITEMMGHDSEETTKIYLQDFPQHTLDEAAMVLSGMGVDR